jgi:hypothetical protein
MSSRFCFVFVRTAKHAARTGAVWATLYVPIPYVGSALARSIMIGLVFVRIQLITLFVKGA